MYFFLKKKLIISNKLKSADNLLLQLISAYLIASYFQRDFTRHYYEPL